MEQVPNPFSYSDKLTRALIRCHTDAIDKTPLPVIKDMRIRALVNMLTERLMTMNKTCVILEAALVHKEVELQDAKPKLIDQCIYEYPGDVFVLFDPYDGGSGIIGAYRTAEEARQDLKEHEDAMDGRKHQQAATQPETMGCFGCGQESCDCAARIGQLLPHTPVIPIQDAHPKDGAVSMAVIRSNYKFFVREIGEGDWRTVGFDEYDRAQRNPHLDTRVEKP